MFWFEFGWRKSHVDSRKNPVPYVMVGRGNHYPPSVVRCIGNLQTHSVVLVLAYHIRELDRLVSGRQIGKRKCARAKRHLFLTVSLQCSPENPTHCVLTLSSNPSSVRCASQVPRACVHLLILIFQSICSTQEVLGMIPCLTRRNCLSTSTCCVHCSLPHQSSAKQHRKPEHRKRSSSLGFAFIMWIVVFC